MTGTESDASVTWKCPECSDPMPAKFRRSHAVICRWASRNEATAVDALLDSLGLSDEVQR